MPEVRKPHPRLSLLFILGLSVVGLGACDDDVVPNQTTLPACTGVEKTCGPNHDEDCCDSRAIVGGLFNRANDASFVATVNDFELDRFEVTVGRFRQFVEDYPNSKPKAGDGAHPLIEDSGWNAAWDSDLPADQGALQASLRCDEHFRTWTDTPDAAENRPLNCVGWYVAFAFCAWDGGRLPTEAEWSYAASGGNEQRGYPWGAAAPDPDHALYCAGYDTTLNSCPLSDIVEVGSRSPAGDGKWGHADLAGSMFEWTLDWFNTFPKPCTNCANLKSPDPSSARTAWGGDWSHEAFKVASSYRLGFSVKKGEPTQAFLGFRCARVK